MKPLPSNLIATGRTPLYNNHSMPAGLGLSHRTRARTWARITVLSGRLRYRSLATTPEAVILAPHRPGVVPPEERHRVEPLGAVEFYLEFFQEPAESADGPAAALLRRLRQEHVNFRLLLDLLERQLVAFERAMRPDYELMEDVVRYMREYPDRFHHPWEDLIFARLANADTAIQPIVAELKRQHAALARSGSDLLDSLRGAVAGVLLPRDALEEPGRRYVALFRSHMDTEEKELFPLFRQHLSSDDWRAMERMMAARKDPVFGLQVTEGYERLHREIDVLRAGEGAR